jgi:hypothetical protein
MDVEVHPSYGLDGTASGLERPRETACFDHVHPFIVKFD